jgi:hypothetical protein
MEPIPEISSAYLRLFPAGNGMVFTTLKQKCHSAVILA